MGRASFGFFGCAVALMLACQGLGAQQRQTQTTDHTDSSQSVAARNPLEGQPDAITSGRSMFRLRCTRCHGVDARGFTGPDLTTGTWTHGDTDPQIFKVIKSGVPGTEMPAANFADNEIWRIVSYLRSLAASGASAEHFELKGKADNGERIFFGSGGCGTCHRAKGKGGHLGPDLSRGFAVRSSRARDALVKDIRNASDTIRPGYEAVTLVTRDGAKIRGAKKNEDTFSIQIMDSRERLLGFAKSDLREVSDEKGSLMPDYSKDRLSDSDLDDVVSYLDSLRSARRATR